MRCQVETGKQSGRESLEHVTSLRFLLHGAKVSFTSFRGSDPLKSYLRFKTAYFIGFDNRYILISSNRGSQAYKEKYEMQIPQ